MEAMICTWFFPGLMGRSPTECVVCEKYHMKVEDLWVFFFFFVCVFVFPTAFLHPLGSLTSLQKFFSWYLYFNAKQASINSFSFLCVVFFSAYLRMSEPPAFFPLNFHHLYPSTGELILTSSFSGFLFSLNLIWGTDAKMRNTEKSWFGLKWI